jgi:hypothetical protein
MTISPPSLRGGRKIHGLNDTGTKKMWVKKFKSPTVIRTKRVSRIVTRTICLCCRQLEAAGGNIPLCESSEHSNELWAKWKKCSSKPQITWRCCMWKCIFPHRLGFLTIERLNREIIAYSRNDELCEGARTSAVEGLAWVCSRKRQVGWYFASQWLAIKNYLKKRLPYWTRGHGASSWFRGRLPWNRGPPLAS